jgi:hypothetical protein
MMIPSQNLSAAIDRVRGYLMEDRPLNLDEMRELVALFDQFSLHFKNIVKNEQTTNLLGDWRLVNSWNNAKLTFGTNRNVL